MTTVATLGVVHHLLEQLAGDGAFVFVIFFLDEPGLLGDIGGVEEQYAIGAEPVSSSPAGFLIIALKIFREILVDDKAYVRFVDAHAKGDRGADHL